MGVLYASLLHFVQLVLKAFSSEKITYATLPVLNDTTQTWSYLPVKSALTIALLAGVMVSVFPVLNKTIDISATPPKGASPK